MEKDHILTLDKGRTTVYEQPCTRSEGFDVFRFIDRKWASECQDNEFGEIILKNSQGLTILSMGVYTTHHNELLMYLLRTIK